MYINSQVFPRVIPNYEEKRETHFPLINNRRYSKTWPNEWEKKTLLAETKSIGYDNLQRLVPAIIQLS